MKRSVSAVGKIVLVILIGVTFLFGLASTVYLSLRSSEVKVPDVVGKDRLTAESALADSGLNIRVRATRPSADAKPDTVLMQVPRAGEKVKSGQTVAVDVSRVPKQGEASISIASAEKKETEKKAEENKEAENANQNQSATKNDNQNANQNQNKPKKNKNTNANANGKNANNSNNVNNSNNGNNANRSANNRNANQNVTNRNTNNTNRNANPANVNRTTNNANTNRRAPVTTTTPVQNPVNRRTP